MKPVLANPRTVFRETWAAGIEAEPRMVLSEWADRHRILSGKYSAEPGPWRTERTPYLREIMDNLSPESPIERVVVVKGTQLGLTEAGNNFLAYAIGHVPGPFLYVQPTVDLAREVSKHRIAPMIAEMPVLRRLIQESRSRRDENTILVKEFPGGYLTLTGANSAVGLRHRTARYLFLDEIDGYPPDVGGEGDPVALALKRTDTFARIRKILICSTPTVRDVSRVEREFERTDKRYYQVSCPHCSGWQVITWERIKFDPARARETARMECEHCKGTIEEQYKPTMLTGGRWMPTAEGAPGVRGYHLSALYSPLGWYSWGQAAEEFIRAKHAGREELQVWVNTCIAETWEEEGDEIEEEPLLARTEEYPARVPEGALLLTCGVDIQADRIELEVVGWGLGEESWGIEYRRIWGDTSNTDTKTGIWAELAQYLETTRFATTSDYDLDISCTFIDSGYRTDQVYAFCRSRSALRIFAIKGQAGAGYPIIKVPMRKQTGAGRAKTYVILVGHDKAADTILHRLLQSQGEQGYCHWPQGHGYDPEWFRQIASMRRVLRYQRGVPRHEWHLRSGRRNEAFDCRRYAFAALLMLNVNWQQLSKVRGEQGGAELRRAQDSPREARPAPPRRLPGKRRGFVHGWRY